MKNFGTRISDGGLTGTRTARAQRGLLHSIACNPQSAFSLVEVLVALTVFALAAIMLASSYVNVLNSYSIATQTAANADDLAYARSLILTQPDITQLQNGGEFDTADNRHAKWTADIQPTQTADLYTVTFTCEISGTNQGDPDKTIQTFMVLRPTWSVDAGARGQLKQDAKNRILEMQGKVAGMGTPGVGGTSTPPPPQPKTTP